MPTGMRSRRSDSARSAPSICSEFSLAAGRSRLSSDEVSAAMRCSSTANESLLPPVRESWSTLDDSVCTSSLSRTSASLEATLETMRAKCGDGAFELMDGRGIVVGAQDQVELGAEIADRLVIAGQLLGRRQRAQRFADFAERAFDAGQGLAVGAALAGVVDAARQRADFVLDRFDRAARHRLGDGGANLGQFAAERRDRLLDPSGRCSASIWLVILNRWRSSEEKSGPAGAVPRDLAARHGGPRVGASWRAPSAAPGAAASAAARCYRVRSGAR